MADEMGALTLEMYRQLLAEKVELQADMKQIKETIDTLLTKIGMYNADGSIRETISVPALMSTLMGVATGGKKQREQFAFLADIVPLITKYKDL